MHRAIRSQAHTASSPRSGQDSFWSRLRVYVQLSTTVAGVEFRVSVPFKQPQQVSVRKKQQPQRTSRCHSSAAASNPGVQALRKRLQVRPDLLARWEAAGEQVTDELLWRWLKSKGGIEEAERTLLQHAQWRINLGHVSVDDIRSELAAEKVFVQGCDMHGRPVVVVLAARHIIRHRNLDETRRLITYTLETAVAAADTFKNPLGQILCLFDLSGLGLGNLDTKALQAVFEVLQQHFPESLSELWFLNAPFIFWGLWRVVSPFIQPATRDKIQFLSGSRRAAVLEENIAAQVLPKSYGGMADLVRVEQAAKRNASKQAEAEALARISTVAGPEAKAGRIAAIRRVGGRALGGSWAFVREHNPAWAARSIGSGAKRAVLAIPRPGFLGKRPGMTRHATALSIHVQNAWRNRPPMPRPSYRLPPRTVEAPHLAYIDVAAFYLILVLFLALGVLLYQQRALTVGVHDQPHQAFASSHDKADGTHTQLFREPNLL